jgi:hypothetical protein
MMCPVCGRRPARRTCPARREEICAVCCATKRLTEIQCPDSCRYLASSREHPPAAVVRQRENDLAHLVAVTRDYSDRQTAVFVLVNRTILAFEPAGFQPLNDDDVAEAAGAMASTLETAAKGLIYEQRPASLPAARLVDALRPAIDRAGEGGGTSFERETAVVFRDIERLAWQLAGSASDVSGGYVALMRRTLGTAAQSRGHASEPEAPRLILP